MCRGTGTRRTSYEAHLKVYLRNRCVITIVCQGNRVPPYRHANSESMANKELPGCKKTQFSKRLARLEDWFWKAGSTRNSRRFILGRFCFSALQCTDLRCSVLCGMGPGAAVLGVFGSAWSPWEGIGGWASSSVLGTGVSSLGALLPGAVLQASHLSASAVLQLGKRYQRSPVVRVKDDGDDHGG